MSKLGSLKITTIAENLVQAGGLGQWGLSFLLELQDAHGDYRKVLFDTAGHREAFLYNVKEKRIDLSDIDAVFISHGHWDHTAATVDAVSQAGGVKVYGHPLTFTPRWYINKNGEKSTSGINEGQGRAEIEAAGGELVLSSDPVEIVPGLWTTGEIDRVTSFEGVNPPRAGTKRFFLVDGDEVTDLIQDDMAVWADVEGAGPYVITGCAHSGPVNTVLQAQRLGGFESIAGLVGGTHLIGRTDEYLNATIHELKKFGLKMISPCHCTGFKATVILMNAFPEEFVLNFCNREIEAGKMPKDRVR